MNLQISTTTCHEMIWQGQSNRRLIIGAIFNECITKGKSLYWYWADFTGSWYKNAQNAYNQMGAMGVISDPFTSSNVLSRAMVDYPNFEIPSRDLINEYSDIYYVTIDDFNDGLYKMALLHQKEFEFLINCIFYGIGTNITNAAMLQMNPELYQNSFDFAFQYIVMGRQKYKRGQNQ